MCFLSVYLLFNNTHPALNKTVVSKTLSFCNYAQLSSTSYFLLPTVPSIERNSFVSINPEDQYTYSTSEKSDSCRGPSYALSSPKLFIFKLFLTNIQCAICQYCKVISCHFWLLRPAQRTFLYSAHATVNSAWALNVLHQTVTVLPGESYYFI